jgi:hypothetical protein
MFPSLLAKSVHVIVCALHANGASSYRDAANLVHVTMRQFGSTKMHGATIITDDLEQVRKQLRNLAADVPQSLVAVIHVQNKSDLLNACTETLSNVSLKSDVLFVVSSHGYQTRTTTLDAKQYETDRLSEYIRVGGMLVLDRELRNSLLIGLNGDATMLCIVDTCHSGTLLDLPQLYDNASHIWRNQKEGGDIQDSKAKIYCLSACADRELSSEDIGEVGGWGGGLCSNFVDFVHKSDRNANGGCWALADMYKNLHGTLLKMNQHINWSRTNSFV